MNRGPKRIAKSTSVSDVRGLRSGPQNRGSFPFDRATYPDPLSFASQKRTLAFYSSMENAPFGVNRKQNGFLEKVCKSVLFFAHIQEMDSPEWQTGAFAGPDWRWNYEGSGSVYLRRCRVETLIYLLTEPPGFEWGGVGPAFPVPE